MDGTLYSDTNWLGSCDTYCSAHLRFFLARLTGDPVRLLLPDQATQADVEAMRTTLGLNRPIIEQY